MKITVNIEEVAQGAAYLKQKSSQYQQMIEQIYACMHQMQAVWHGSDHQAFINQLDQFRPHLQKLTNVIDEYAQYLSQSARLYQQVQEDRVAKARTLA